MTLTESVWSCQYYYVSHWIAALLSNKGKRERKYFSLFHILSYRVKFWKVCTILRRFRWLNRSIWLAAIESTQVSQVVCSEPSMRSHLRGTLSQALNYFFRITYVLFLYLPGRVTKSTRRCTKIVGGWGFAPDPLGKISALPRRSSWLSGAYF